MIVNRKSNSEINSILKEEGFLDHQKIIFPPKKGSLDHGRRVSADLFLLEECLHSISLAN